MEVIIKGIEGIDVPVTKEGEEYEKLQKAMEKQIRERLQLRSTDEVTFQIQKSKDEKIVEYDRKNMLFEEFEKDKSVEEGADEE